MGIGALKRAIFLDRDGVLNLNVLNPATGEYESPHRPDDLRLYPDVFTSLKRLQDAGYLLFIVSNQPSYAKGKTSLENIQAIAAKLDALLSTVNIAITKSYYCHHHPDGVIAGFSGPCPCRKPSPFFLRQAEREFGIDMQSSWMLGDRDTDIQCGRTADVQTILVNTDPERTKKFPSLPEHIASNLTEAVNIILSSK